MYVHGRSNIKMLHKYLSAVLMLMLIGEGRIIFRHVVMLLWPYFCVLLHYAEYIILSAVDCQCEQNFVFPSANFPQIPDDVDYDHSLCFDCSANSFTLVTMGNPQTPVNMNTSLVMISTTFVPGRFVLVIPVPRNAFGSDSATIACSGNSFRISELGEKSTIILTVHKSVRSDNNRCNSSIKFNVLFFFCFFFSVQSTYTQSQWFNISSRRS